jgi:hypothetical protein
MMTMSHLNGLQNGELSNYAMRRQIYSAKSAQSEKRRLRRRYHVDDDKDNSATHSARAINKLYDAGLLRLPEDKK